MPRAFPDKPKEPNKSVKQASPGNFVSEKMYNYAEHRHASHERVREETFIQPTEARRGPKVTDVLSIDKAIRKR